MEFSRILNLSTLLEKKSFFLFGPRQTGKSFLIHQQLSSHALVIDLLNSDVELRLKQDPGYLKNLIESKTGKQKYVVIDEIQKLPFLLDTVHSIIERKGIHFLLTGSSSRKLKRFNVNLLGGRAWNAELFPLTFKEIPDFSLEKKLLIGSLPQVYLSSSPFEELKAYVSNYLVLEVQIEGLVRKLPNFFRFLKGAALSHTQILNFTNISNDYGVPVSSVRDYYDILQDLLLGFIVPRHGSLQKRKALGMAKFYFFDIGLVHSICGVNVLNEHTHFFARSFEHFIAMEIKSYLSYLRKDDTLQYWQSEGRTHEVDFIVGDHTAIEVKSCKRVSKNDLKGLKKLSETKKLKNVLLVSRDEIEAKFDNIRGINWKVFLKKMWNNELF